MRERHRYRGGASSPVGPVSTGPLFRERPFLISKRRVHAFVT